jgi:pyruvate dehydrogenase E1 component
MAVIVQDGLRRMFVDQEDVYYYLTVENENYHHPGMPEGVEEGIIRGLYRFSETSRPGKKHVNLMSCGAIFRQAMMARGHAQGGFRHHRRHLVGDQLQRAGPRGPGRGAPEPDEPDEEPQEAFVTSPLKGAKGPVIAATDYMKNFAEQIRAFVPQAFHTLGTDGFGRSDSRVNLRRHFEVDANHIAATAVYALFRRARSRRPRSRRPTPNTRSTRTSRQSAHGLTAARGGETKDVDDRSEGAGYRRLHRRAGDQR